jgi:hypothetical protein
VFDNLSTLLSPFQKRCLRKEQNISAKPYHQIFFIALKKLKSMKFQSKLFAVQLWLYATLLEQHAAMELRVQLKKPDVELELPLVYEEGIVSDQKGKFVAQFIPGTVLEFGHGLKSVSETLYLMLRSLSTAATIGRDTLVSKDEDFAGFKAWLGENPSSDAKTMTDEQVLLVAHMVIVSGNWESMKAIASEFDAGVATNMELAEAFVSLPEEEEE